MDSTLNDHPVILSLTSQLEQLRRRIESLEGLIREDHEKLTRLEHEVEHDHEIIDRLEHPGSSSYYTGRKSVTVGL